MNEHFFLLAKKGPGCIIVTLMFGMVSMFDSDGPSSFEPREDVLLKLRRMPVGLSPSTWRVGVVNRYRLETV